MRNNEKIITMSIDMYLSNLSSRKMRNQLNRHFGTKISHISILDWVRKYVMKVQKYVNKFQPKLGGKIYADETICMRKKNQDVFWCSVDWDTRFINATLYSPQDQNLTDATQFMNSIRKSSNSISEVTTDSLGVYIPAFKKVFYSNKGKRTEQTKHTAINFSKSGKHNVRIETVFSKIKDRVYDFRGLKALWSAPILLAGIVLQHNWIEQHTTLKDYPCQRAGLKLETGQNRWLGLIRIATTSASKTELPKL
ncbi:MAG: DDE-type integrase/transposase/recombinase [Candidatus Woesearchaeota archaeon]